MSRRHGGQAVMVVMVGAMLGAGLAVWLATGDFHIMPGHGPGKQDSHAELRHVPSAPGDSAQEDPFSHEADSESAASDAGDSDEPAGKNP